MNKSIPRQFANITAMLEDLGAVAIEGQCRSHSPDMQAVLAILLRSGLAALDTEMRSLAKALEGCSQ